MESSDPRQHAIFSVATRLQPHPGMSSNPVRIGVACPLPGERAAFLEWLTDTGYEPVPMLNLETVAKELPARPIEALIADVALVSAADLPRVVRMLGPNRPLILVGAAKDRIEEVPRDASWITRPATKDIFGLSIALALAEGRPARRSPRQVVPKVLATIDGVASKIIDVSDEGVRLEIPAGASAALDRKSTRLNSSHSQISYAVFCLKKKKKKIK